MSHPNQIDQIPDRKIKNQVTNNPLCYSVLKIIQTVFNFHHKILYISFHISPKYCIPIDGIKIAITVMLFVLMGDQRHGGNDKECLQQAASGEDGLLSNYRR